MSKNKIEDKRIPTACKPNKFIKLGLLISISFPPLINKTGIYTSPGLIV